VTPESIAAWCDEEYRRLASRPSAGPRSGDDQATSGRMAALAELAAMIRTGRLARHCAARAEWLERQARQADDDAEAFGWTR